MSFGKVMDWNIFGDSNTLTKMGFGSGENILTGGVPLGYRFFKEDVGKLFKKPDMPEVAPLPAAAPDTSALEAAARAESERLRNRKGMKSTILTSNADSLMNPAVTQKAELLGS